MPELLHLQHMGLHGAQPPPTCCCSALACCCCLLLPQVLKQLADALKELDGTVQEAAEALQQQGAGEGEGEAAGAPPAAVNGQAEAEGGSEAEDGSDGGFGFDQEAFTAGQLAAARGVRSLLAEAVGLLKLLAKQLLAER